MYKSIILIAFTLSNIVFGSNEPVYHFLKIVESTSQNTVEQKIDSSQILKVVEENLNVFRNRGYLLATCDTLYSKGDSLIIHISKRIKFNRFDLRIDTGICKHYPELCKGIDKIITSSLNIQTISKLHQKIEDYFGERGFPFLSFEYDSVEIYENKIKAKLEIYPSRIFHFDTLVLNTGTKSKNVYLQALLGIRKGSLYNQKKVLEIKRIISKTGFLELVSEPYVSFRFEKAYVHLELREKGLTKINGFIGLAPDRNPQKMTLVGEVDLSFRNLLGYGVGYSLNWKRFQSQSQNANMQLSVPFLFKSPVGTNFGLEILKQDTSFVNISRKIEFGYHINSRVQASLGYRYYSSTVNSNYTDKLFPIIANRTKQYGTTLTVNTFNDLFFPTSGVLLGTDLYIGEKHINGLVNDSLQKETTQFNASFYIEKIFRVSRKSTLLTKNHNKMILNSKNEIYANDQYRLGGINDLRGFGEKSFFANKYAFMALEYRLLTTRDSYGAIFLNMAIIENRLDNLLQYPIGGGLGYVFKTGVGVFQFFYSLGKSRSDVIALENSKVHIAVTNDF